MSKKVIDGEQFQKMVASAANSLDTEKTEINNLNVFPVPDGDTGINMSLTMKPARDVQVEPGTLAEAASRVANRLLRSARGNSGAILSLFFRGMSKSFEGLESADSDDIAKALRSGTNEAYRAVSKPSEGTILTVMRGTAEIAEAESSRYRGNPEAFFERLLEGAQDVLDQTPEMLPVLKQANVVDAGGQGFVTVLKGMLASLQGNDVAAVGGSDGESAERDEGANFGDFDPDSITFAYCTECIVGKSDRYRGEGTAEAFKEFIAPLGDSMVFVDDEEIVKVHIHTNDPGMVLSEALKYGALEMVKIENMKKQHSALTAAGEKAAKGEVDAPIDYTPDKDFGFVAVCLGAGTAGIFRELGVHEIVTGGQTMNPSTDNLLDAIRRTRGREVFVLPNNKNIIMVAKQAASIIEAEFAEGITQQKRVIVLETRSVPEGMSAMLAFDPTSSADDNAAAMTETYGSVHTLSVTRAVKDATIDGLSIKAGHYMGLCDRKIGYTGARYESIVLKMLRNFPDASFVTVLYGDEITEAKAKALFAKMQEVVPNAECNLLYGGQPLYDFVISVE